MCTDPKQPHPPHTLTLLISSSLKLPISKASCALTSPRGGTRGGVNFLSNTSSQLRTEKNDSSFISSELHTEKDYKTLESTCTAALIIHILILDMMILTHAPYSPVSSQGPSPVVLLATVSLVQTLIQRIAHPVYREVYWNSKLSKRVYCGKTDTHLFKRLFVNIIFLFCIPGSKRTVSVTRERVYSYMVQYRSV